MEHRFGIPGDAPSELPLDVELPMPQAVRERRPNIGFGTPGPIPSGTVDSINVIRKMIAKGVDGIAVAAANAAAMASVMPAAKEAGIPVLTWDTDLLPEAKEFRVAYIGTHNYDIGVELAKLVWELRRKLEPFGAEHLIENERRLGYRMRTCSD